MPNDHQDSRREPQDQDQGQGRGGSGKDQEDGFNIRAWMERHGVSLPVDDSDVRAEVTALLRRDLRSAFALPGDDDNAVGVKPSP